tara:strand:- start:4303 stop:4749 length:447 start_codon:yes stop_codon:yes gene_type:complete
MASAGTLFLASSAVSAIGTLSSVQAQRAAIARENYRIETEQKLATLKALEEENFRRAILKEAIANNFAYQSIAGYYDDGRSFMNINKQATNKANKDIANIRLMGSNVQNKFTAQLFENDLKEDQLVFGGYTSATSDILTGYANYKWYS